MTRLDLLAVSAAMAVLAASQADAQQRPVMGARINYPSHANHFSWERGHGFHGGFGGGVWIVEREVPVIVEREVVVPLRQAQDDRAQEKPPPRKPYVLGASYASLPGGCMKMIESGASYYWCGGAEWYRPVGNQYRAVARP